VLPLANGSYRNHCPYCLWSKHVDGVRPGDRACSCHGMMQPVAVDHRGGKGLVIVHRCTTCRFVRSNRVAQDQVQADSIETIIDLMRAAWH
jgi:hypothetical protein